MDWYSGVEFTPTGANEREEYSTHEENFWTFGLISGAILSVMMLATLPFMDTIGFDRGEIIGYSTMVLAFLLVFFGVRSYRENVGGGQLSFGRAFAVGSLIVAVASVCYTATWELIYYKITPDFSAKYSAHMVEKAKQSGASQAAIDAKVAEMKQFSKMYENPLINVAMTMLEPLPIGIVIALVSAGVLRRKRRDGTAELARSPSVA